MKDISSAYNFVSRDFGADTKHVKVYNISDVHIGAKEARQVEFERFILRLSQEQDAYIVLNGDLANNATRSGVSDIFDEVMRPREQKRWLADALMPIREKILCITSGNHERRSAKDADNDFMGDVAAKLDLEDIYHDTLCVLKLQLGVYNGLKDRRHTFIAVVTHGAGGGMLPGAAANRNERFLDMFEDADALLIGHTHKPMALRNAKAKINRDSEKITIREQLILVACPWMEWGGYGMRKMMRPSPVTLNHIVIDGSAARQLKTRAVI